MADTPRALLYTAVFLLLGALAIPGVIINRRIGRVEKVCLCIAAGLQTLVAVAVLVGFVIWILTAVERAMAGDPRGANPFGF
jgi:hypothetical protein